MNFNKYTEDDYCDIYSNRICDNCGDCLKEYGIDLRAIKIEDIAKTVEENEFLENEYKKALEASEEEIENLEDNTEAFIDDSYTFIEEGYNDEYNDEYIDAFENVEYIDDLNIFTEGDFEELTEEIYPGFRKYKG
ncbi:hypothetical protein [Clostridium isatidis]|uniref:Uncharacterized protein n=1 Tax=Clostridium isatidis TaxID=182773 RepID=A0A343JBB3_9CLOT|nr:hypothetical protein [Clostridium isatidis]ASW42821.1 hypothetical protein BEN51_04845 [Clostridium isatidis]NLZ35825.1 hypothetical protein [Clostridiales bacterium]